MEIFFKLVHVTLVWHGCS